MTNNSALIFCCALLLDCTLGELQLFPHPVVMIGKFITFLHSRLFTGSRDFTRGLPLCVLTLTVTGLAVALVLMLTGCSVFVEVYMIYAAIAWRDLKDETVPVLSSLLRHDVNSARAYLSRVVGRDTEPLTEPEIVRAVIETVAENSIDGVMSVMFYAALGQVVAGEAGMCVSVWLFKAASTLDSMTGYESYGAYGTPGARLDDALNFLPARLGGLVIVIASGGRGMRVFLRDRLKHKSPNSAHGESAFSGVLGVRLGGGAYYGGVYESREVLNAGGRECEVMDIVRAWRVLDESCGLFALVAVSVMIYA